MFLLLLPSIEIDSILNKFVLTAMFAQANFIEWCLYFRHLNVISKTSARITILPISLFSLPWKRGCIFAWISIDIHINIYIHQWFFISYPFFLQPFFCNHFFHWNKLKLSKCFSYSSRTFVSKYRKWIYSNDSKIMSSTRLNCYHFNAIHRILHTCSINYNPNAKVSLINLSKKIDIFNGIIIAWIDLSWDLLITMVIFQVLSSGKKIALTNVLTMSEDPLSLQAKIKVTTCVEMLSLV